MRELQDRLGKALTGRYRLLREIGRGGAAIIYLADDLKHDRRVALKVFRPDLAASLGSDRFLREIKIAAKLSHPHILPVHDSGDAGGFLYYVMPVVEGHSLRDRLARDGVMSLADVAALLHDLLDALHYAHQRGVVHRDIKPGNVMLSGRHAMVTDFGVAKALEAAAEGRESDTAGLVLGTPAYMAPEQATADPDIDHRADIYGVGALAYEMLTGRTPFEGETAQSILGALVSKVPDPVQQHRPETPPELAQLVMKCLEKDPNERWQTSEEALQQLDALAATPAGGLERISVATKPPRAFWTPRRRIAAAAAAIVVVMVVIAGLSVRGPQPGGGSTLPVIAVLPFENLGPPEDEYFANGVTDAITARLASLGTLAVISRTSAMQYRDSDLSSREIGAELGADYILEGTIQRERPSDPTSRVRIIPQLIRTSDDTHMWASVYDEDLVEVFRVQSEIAERVARAMDVTLAEPQRQRIVGAPTTNLEAYELYLRGHDYLEGSRGSGDANARRIAIDFFDDAIALDGEFALAWAEQSVAHIWLYRHFVDHTDRRALLAKAAVDTALALASDLPKAHLALGLYYYWGPESDAALALEEFQHVSEREPNNAYALTLIAVLQAARGQWDEAVANAALAAELDPREPDWAVTAGMFHFLLRRYEDAERYLDLALELSPDNAAAFQTKIALQLRWRGDTARAHSVANEMLARVTPGQVALALVEVAPELIAGGAYDSVFQQLSPGSLSGPYPFDYYFTRAEFNRLRSRPALSRAYFDSLATAVRAAPAATGDPVVSMFLGRAYAGMGDRSLSLRQAGLLETELLQANDALRALAVRVSLVWIYGMLGEDDAAIDHLEALLEVPSPVSLTYLRIAALTGTIRLRPRFQELVSEGAPPGPPIEAGMRSMLAGRSR